MSAPRLLMLVTSTERRGGEVFGEQIARGLAERGWETSSRALVRGDGPSIEAEPLVDKPRPALKTLDLEVIRAARSAIRDFGPDVVFANGGGTLPVAVGATSLKSGVQLVYGSIGEPLYWARSDRARRQTGFLMRRCDLVTSISHPTRRQIVEGLGVPDRKVVVAHPGVGVRYFDIASSEPGGDLRVLYLGSLAPEKGPLSALAAAERASERTGLRMRFVGGGRLLDDVNEAVRRRELGEIVEVLGPVADVEPHLAWADVLVLASESEGVPGVLLEAGAAGVPAVSVDVGGISDVIDDGKTGLLVDRGDVDAMAAGLVRLAHDRTLLASMANAVRERIRSQFTLKKSIDRYDDIMRALIEGRPIPSGVN